MNSIEQAKDALETARNADNGSIVDRKLAEAQAAATVAVAEQQRIANEIAYLRFALDQIQSGHATNVDNDGMQELANRVAEGLGL